jgi:anti-sigma factor RsiW
MNDTKLSPDDPRLTAYALGELEGDERAAVESALKTDAAARAAVDQIRATARQIEAALAAEPMPELKAITAPLAQRAAIIPSHDPGKLDGGPLPLQNLIRFPQAYYLIGGLAAACFAVMVTLHESEVMHRAQQQEAAQTAARELESKESAAVTATAKPSPYTEVSFPVPSIPAGRVEIQSLPQAAAADKTVAPGASAASNQLVEGQTIVVSKLEVAAAPAHGYSASETITDSRVNTKIVDLPLAGSDFISVARNPLSTFALDVGTASYGNVRRFLQAGKKPPADAVHIEELVNYFSYAYAAPRDHAPLAATLEVAAAPWAPTHRLVRIGLKARDVTAGGKIGPVAKNVTVQVEFNPAQVQLYRLIGYDSRTLKREDFSKDAITAGDLGAGHMVTALYEVVPVGVEPPATPGAGASKYGKVESQSAFAEATAEKEPRVEGAGSKELLTVKVSYTPPEGGAGRQLEFPLTDRGATFAEASMDFKFAAAVAGFGLILRESPDKGGATLAAVEQWAGQGLGPDAGGYRAEFIGLVHQAEKLKE